MITTFCNLDNIIKSISKFLLLFFYKNSQNSKFLSSPDIIIKDSIEHVKKLIKSSHSQMRLSKKNRTNILGEL